MANFLAPTPLQDTFFIPGGNVPGNGVLLFTYTNLTSTKTTVYKGPTTSTAWTNPIVLDSGGNLPLGAELWIPSGETITAKYCPANDSDPPTSPYRTLDDLSGMNDFDSTDSEWIAGPTPTFVSATSFTLVGDQTSTFEVGRRVKTTNTGGTIYSRIISSVFGALTTVTVVNDSGVLDSGLSTVFFALLSATNPSVPLITDAYPIRSNATNKSKLFAVNVEAAAASTTITETVPSYSFVPNTQNIAADISASSGIINASTATGSIGTITGTTAITQITMFPGQDFTAIFSSTVTLVNSTSMSLPGATNIFTKNGDIARFRGTSSNIGLLTSYQIASVVPGAFGEQLLAFGSALNTSLVTIPYSSAPYTNFRNKRLVITTFIPATDGTLLTLRFSSSGAASFFSGATQYASEYVTIDNTNANTSVAFATTSVWMTNNTVGNLINEGVSADVKMYDTQASVWQRCSFHTHWVDNSGPPRSAMSVGGGLLASTSINNAAQVAFASGNISSGAWSLYGSN